MSTKNANNVHNEKVGLTITWNKRLERGHTIIPFFNNIFVLRMEIS